ncbi:holin [Ventosimonas gracilis]|uniref:Holin n=1 Tax=Ventosimonas gracilis TaxID=1680762 RepID=A0A139SMW6_9GAMM|nr:HNH endonuclease signature motif containing protein [Ventosimonas gracilis]KXU35859.1 holin [Ventosimonas gracilis]
MSQHSHVYHNPRWRKARLSFLQRRPLCVLCQQVGQVTAASVVDHIRPHRLGQALQSGQKDSIQQAQALFWDSANWQPLCKPCHDRHKARQERSGQLKGCDAQGNPLSGDW